MNSTLCSIATRTNGDISIGVIGPVRSGKSTFITNFLQKVVIPRVENDKDRSRCLAELPQIFDGKSVVTIQPQICPSKGVIIDCDGKISGNFRLIDGIGYPVVGAEGLIEDGGMRKIATPWSSESVDFETASKICSQKICCELSNVIFVVTTDGSIVDIGREGYVLAEEKAIFDAKYCEKPVIIVFNTTDPVSEINQAICKSLETKYGLRAISMDVANATEGDFAELLKVALEEFSLRKIGINLPKWMRALSADSKVMTEIIEKIKLCSSNMGKLKDAKHLCDNLQCDYLSEVQIADINCGNGAINYNLIPTKDLFFKVLTDEAGADIDDEFSLMNYVTASSYAKKQFEIFKDAISEADTNGYGVVYPLMERLTLDEPQMIKQGGIYGVKLSAKAPSYHIIKVDVNADVSPMVGTEEQSQYLIEEYKNNPQKIWNTNMFGRTMSGIANDGLVTKSASMPVEVKQKLVRAVNRIVNENKGGVICILL